MIIVLMLLSNCTRSLISNTSDEDRPNIADPVLGTKFQNDEFPPICPPFMSHFCCLYVYKHKYYVYKHE